MDTQGLPYMPNSFRGKTTPLPPIICEKDKKTLNDVKQYISSELKKLKHTVTGPDDHKYWIYSTAFSMLINNLTVYKDILSDIKREYEDCIGALKNGQREVKFLQVKIKTMTSLPTTVSGYKRRKLELEEKLEVLEADNLRLENTLKDLLKREEDENESEEEIVTVKEDKVEKRPIPGLPVIDWTNEKILKMAVENLDNAIEELIRQKRTAYVPNEQKEEVHQEFREKMAVKEKLAEECKQLKRRHGILKLVNETIQEYKKLPIRLRTSESLSQFVKRKLGHIPTRIDRSSSDTPQTEYEIDDPSKEKEAEMILEYIEKFNELLYDKEYASAAIHAANSPRGVLRVMETLLRFKEASESFEGTPSPLLMYAEALMSSSSAQSHVADEEMSFECVSCALKENRSDMVLHWIAQGCVTSCKKVADALAEYADTSSQHKQNCLVAAQKMYAESKGCKIYAASLLYRLGQVAGMLEYTTLERFILQDYFDLIKECLDANLIWILCNTSEEEFIGEERKYSGYQPPLPISLSHSLFTLLNTSDEGRDLVVTLLEQIYKGRKHCTGQQAEGETFVPADLSRLVYEDGNNAYDEELVRKRWKSLAEECEVQEKHDIGMEIRAAIVVHNVLIKALRVLAEDEKEQFDYYR